MKGGGAVGWTVYMLRCGDGTLYTGCTNDLPRRLEAHRSGRGAKYTRSRPPVALAYREEVPDRFAALRREGVEFMIVSNNRSGKRVEAFCGDLGVSYQGHAGKPSPRGLLAAMERAGRDAAHTAMLGDKLLTDVLAANRAGVLALMVEPAGGAVTPWQKVLHALQAPFKAASRRRFREG